MSKETEQVNAVAPANSEAIGYLNSAAYEHPKFIHIEMVAGGYIADSYSGAEPPGRHSRRFVASTAAALARELRRWLALVEPEAQPEPKPETAAAQ